MPIFSSSSRPRSNQMPAMIKTKLLWPRVNSKRFTVFKSFKLFTPLNSRPRALFHPFVKNSMAHEERDDKRIKYENIILGDKSRKLLKMTVSTNSYDFRQSMLALFMVMFFVSSMSLVWTSGLELFQTFRICSG